MLEGNSSLTLGKVSESIIDSIKHSFFDENNFGMIEDFIKNSPENSSRNSFSDKSALQDEIRAQKATLILQQLANSFLCKNVHNHPDENTLEFQYNQTTGLVQLSPTQFYICCRYLLRLVQMGGALCKHVPSTSSLFTPTNETNFLHVQHVLFSFFYFLFFQLFRPYSNDIEFMVQFDMKSMANNNNTDNSGTPNLAQSNITKNPAPVNNLKPQTTPDIKQVFSGKPIIVPRAAEANKGVPISSPSSPLKKKNISKSPHQSSPFHINIQNQQNLQATGAPAGSGAQNNSGAQSSAQSGPNAPSTVNPPLSNATQQPPGGQNPQQPSFFSFLFKSLFSAQNNNDQNNTNNSVNPNPAGSGVSSPMKHMFQTQQQSPQASTSLENKMKANPQPMQQTNISGNAPQQQQLPQQQSGQQIGGNHEKIENDSGIVGFSEIWFEIVFSGLEHVDSQTQVLAILCCQEIAKQNPDFFLNYTLQRYFLIRKLQKKKNNPLLKSPKRKKNGENESAASFNHYGSNDNRPGSKMGNKSKDSKNSSEKEESDSINFFSSESSLFKLLCTLSHQFPEQFFQKIGGLLLQYQIIRDFIIQQTNWVFQHSSESLKKHKAQSMKKKSALLTLFLFPFGLKGLSSFLYQLLHTCQLSAHQMQAIAHGFYNHGGLFEGIIHVLMSSEKRAVVASSLLYSLTFLLCLTKPMIVDSNPQMGAQTSNSSSSSSYSSNDGFSPDNGAKAQTQPEMFDMDLDDVVSGDWDKKSDQNGNLEKVPKKGASGSNQKIEIPNNWPLVFHFVSTYPYIDEEKKTKTKRDYFNDFVKRIFQIWYHTAMRLADKEYFFSNFSELYEKNPKSTETRKEMGFCLHVFHAFQELTYVLYALFASNFIAFIRNRCNISAELSEFVENLFGNVTVYPISNIINKQKKYSQPADGSSTSSASTSSNSSSHYVPPFMEIYTPILFNPILLKNGITDPFREWAISKHFFVQYLLKTRFFRPFLHNHGQVSSLHSQGQPFPTPVSTPSTPWSEGGNSLNSNSNLTNANLNHGFLSAVTQQQIQQQAQQNYNNFSQKKNFDRLTDEVILNTSFTSFDNKELESTETQNIWFKRIMTLQNWAEYLLTVEDPSTQEELQAAVVKKFYEETQQMRENNQTSATESYSFLSYLQNQDPVKKFPDYTFYENYFDKPQDKGITDSGSNADAEDAPEAIEGEETNQTNPANLSSNDYAILQSEKRNLQKEKGSLIGQVKNKNKTIAELQKKLLLLRNEVIFDSIKRQQLDAHLKDFLNNKVLGFSRGQIDEWVTKTKTQALEHECARQQRKLTSLRKKYDNLKKLQKLQSRSIAPNFGMNDLYSIQFQQQQIQIQQQNPININGNVNIINSQAQISSSLGSNAGSIPNTSNVLSSSINNNSNILNNNSSNMNSGSVSNLSNQPQHENLLISQIPSITYNMNMSTNEDSSSSCTSSPSKTHNTNMMALGQFFFSNSDVYAQMESLKRKVEDLQSRELELKTENEIQSQQIDKMQDKIVEYSKWIQGLQVQVQEAQTRLFHQKEDQKRIAQLKEELFLWERSHTKFLNTANENELLNKKLQFQNKVISDIRQQLDTEKEKNLELKCFLEVLFFKNNFEKPGKKSQAPSQKQQNSSSTGQQSGAGNNINNNNSILGNNNINNSPANLNNAINTFVNDSSSVSSIDGNLPLEGNMKFGLEMFLKERESFDQLKKELEIEKNKRRELEQSMQLRDLHEHQKLSTMKAKYKNVKKINHILMQQLTLKNHKRLFEGPSEGNGNPNNTSNNNNNSNSNNSNNVSGLGTSPMGNGGQNMFQK